MMHNAFFTRFAAAAVAVAPLTLVSALIGIDGSYAGQASGQALAVGSPDATAPAGTPARARPAPPRRPADPTVDSLAHGAGSVVFGRNSDTEPDLSPVSTAIAPASHRGGQDESAKQGRTGDWGAGPATTAHADMPYGRNWIDAPQTAWNAGPAGASRAFTAPAGRPGNGDPAGGADSPVNPQEFYATENPVTVLTAASPSGTPTSRTEEALALPIAPVIAARDARTRVVPEPAALGMALGALGLLGIGRRSKRPARHKA